MTIRNFLIEYDAINSRNTFTNGDTINGRIILETNKETTIQSLEFLAKGKARVRWTEHYGENNTRVYWADEKYYSIKHHILRESRQDGTEVIGKGRHVFPFSFTIPDRKMPSSFCSTVGRIVHKLKAKLKQSMKLTKKAKIHFTYVSKVDMNIPGLMVPQHGSKDKSIAFGSGKVSFDVHAEKMGYKPGEAIKVTVEIKNNSSRSVKPKFVLYEKKSFFAQGQRKVETHKIFKDKSDAIDSHCKKSLMKVINIPRELPASILNCSIIKLEYRMKIYLDIKYASNPEIKLMIILLPDVSDVRHTLPFSNHVGFEAFGNPNQPTWSTTPQAAALPPSYEASAMCPPFHSEKYKTTM